MEPPPEQEPSELGLHLAELGPSTGSAVGGALVGVALGGVPGAVVGAAAGEVAAYVAHEALARRRQRAAAAVEVAAAKTGLTPEDLLARIRADDRLLELAAAVIAAAAETALQAKIRALGQALARGTLATDDATIDQERFMVATLAALEAPHVRLLLEIQRHSWRYDVLQQRLPGLVPVIPPVLSALRANALIHDMTQGSYDYGGDMSAQWTLRPRPQCPRATGGPRLRGDRAGGSRSARRLNRAERSHPRRGRCV